MLNSEGRIPELWNINFEHLVKKVLTDERYQLDATIMIYYHK